MDFYVDEMFPGIGKQWDKYFTDNMTLLKKTTYNINKYDINYNGLCL